MVERRAVETAKTSGESVAKRPKGLQKENAERRMHAQAVTQPSFPHIYFRDGFIEAFLLEE
jgi:hypothetical protein